MTFGEDEIHIMSIGPSGVGKSTIGNKLLKLTSKDPEYLNASASAESCTQKPATVTSGKIVYTDVPGIPDTNPANTKLFYNMIINEAKAPMTAIFFVFAVDMRMDKPTKDRIKQCSLLFSEINKCSAAKILILNDMRAWCNPNGLDDDSDEYQEEKALHDQVRLEVQEAYKNDIIKATCIEFYCTKVIYGLNSKINTDNNMEAVMKYLKLTLQSFPCDASPHLRTFEELEKDVMKAKQNQDYEQRLINEEDKHIASLETNIEILKITLQAATAVAGTAGAAASIANFFTFGTAAVVGGLVAGGATSVATSAKIAIAAKEKELEDAKEKINKQNLDVAVKTFETQYQLFDELKKELNCQ
ncbi:uncharacterized protein [Clytia hemisphaerica]|uniref:G domain-containing protein n=1 Tax=Clytia hemisphaerica TaxID=252671 RepID=A0A7M5XMI3_9CNID|eukprot:TCONS_00041035-protein